jgi:hypothetical protein
VQDGRDVADANVAHALLHKAKGFTHEDMKILQLEGETKPVEYNRYFPPARQPGCPLLAAQPPPQAMAPADRTRAQRDRRQVARARGSRHPGAQRPPPLISTRRSLARRRPRKLVREECRSRGDGKDRLIDR